MSTNEKQNKPERGELTPQQMQKRRKMVIFPLLFLLFAGCMWLIFAPKGDADEQSQNGLNTDLPTPKESGIIGDKREAYVQDAMNAKQQDKMRSLQDFAFSLGEETEEERIAREERQLRMAPKPIEYYEDPSRFEGGSSRGRNAFHSSASAYEDINRQLGSFYTEPEESQNDAQDEMQIRIEELERKLAEEQAAKDAEEEQLRLIEKSYEIAARYMGGTQTAQSETPVVQTPTAVNGKTVVQPVSQVRNDVVSLLAAPISNAEFMEEFVKPRNWGFHTAAGNENVQDKNTIRACVYQTVTLTNGKELQIRLLEPMRAGNILIPAGTVITGACRIGGERMEITVNSIQYAGSIIPVELQVYDMDGQRGIFVPNSDEVKAAKEIASQLANSAGTSIMISDDAASQLTADMGKGLIQGASQYVSKKMSVVKVTVKANYGLLLLPKTN